MPTMLNADVGAKNSCDAAMFGAVEAALASVAPGPRFLPRQLFTSTSRNRWA